MTSSNQNSEDLDFSGFTSEPIDLEKFKENLPEFPSQQLCEIVVSYRYLSILEPEALIAMGELAARRAAGESFNYEEKIEEIMTTLPKLNMDIAKILQSIRL